jgi:hypothetical protein
VDDVAIDLLIAGGVDTGETTTTGCSFGIIEVATEEEDDALGIDGAGTIVAPKGAFTVGC